MMSALGVTANATIKPSAATTVRFILELPSNLLTINMLHPIEKLAQDVPDPFEDSARLSRVVLLRPQDLCL